jgi:hypothetical protein
MVAIRRISGLLWLGVVHSTGEKSTTHGNISDEASRVNDVKLSCATHGRFKKRTDRVKRLIFE